MSLDISISTEMIAILTDPGVGGTFLNWTIHYLRGDSEYFSAKENKSVELPNSPVTGRNAHNFRPNQARNRNEFDLIYTTLLSAPADSTMYFHTFHGSESDDNKDTQYAIDKLLTTANKIVVAELDIKHALYRCRYTPRSDSSQSFFDHEKILSDPDEIFNDFTEYFFASSKQTWDNQNLKDVWDKREFIALNINPFSVVNVTQGISTIVPYYHIDAVNLMTNFDQLVIEMFGYLEIDIINRRFLHWKSVYNTWKTVHHNRLSFMQQFDTIVDNIISGKDFDLVKFNLDIKQEAAIQHQLLYMYNLNLKTWQLTKFVNTKQLHDLLEPNIYHDLGNSNFRRMEVRSS